MRLRFAYVAFGVKALRRGSGDIALPSGCTDTESLVFDEMAFDAACSKADFIVTFFNILAFTLC